MVGPVGSMPNGDENPRPEAIAFATWPSSKPKGIVITGLGSEREPLHRIYIRSANANPVMNTVELKIRFRWLYMVG